MEFLYEYGLFFAKAITIVLAIAAVVVIVLAASNKQKGGSEPGNLELDSLSETFEDLEEMGKQALLSKDELKARQKQLKKEKKEKAKQQKSEKSEHNGQEKTNKNLFVLDFNGSPMAKEVETLRKEITAILCIAKPEDEVLVKVESGGGVVHGYGLAASQLKRIKDKGLRLTISVDKVAASGGYMMACVADKVIAAPFAIIGSIGVIAQLPNFNKLLKKNDVDFEMHTAGDFKRTITMFGENTDEGRAKFQSELDEVHGMFKSFVTDNRPDLDIDKVATGEYWYGTKALELKLVDEIQTSDDFLLKSKDDFKMFTLKYASKRTLAQKLGFAVSEGIENGISKVLTHARTWHI